ncbi:Oligosaccharyl transferase STT3 subunit, partial [mine drainage metagenome]
MLTTAATIGFFTATILIPTILPSVASTAQSYTISEQSPSTLNFAIHNIGIILLLAPIGIILLCLDKEISIKDRAVLLGFALPTTFLFFLQIRWVVLAGIPLAILGAYGAVKLLDTKIARTTKQYLWIAILGATLMVAIIYLLQLGPSTTNYSILQAAQWMRNNTPNNATVLTLWSDGSLIEGWANRTSISDSMMAGQDMPQFAQFLFARSGNLSYLNHAGAQYLVIRDIYYEQYIGAFNYSEYWSIREEGN